MMSHNKHWLASWQQVCTQVMEGLKKNKKEKKAKLQYLYYICIYI